VTDIRVRWAFVYPEGSGPLAGQPTRDLHGRVLTWQVTSSGVQAIVERDDNGRIESALIENLAVDHTERVEAPASLVEYVTAGLPLLVDHIVGEGLEERAAAERDPCGTAIELLKLLQAELLQTGAARDAAVAERDAALRHADTLGTELEAVKKRKRSVP
jgi:hypothetical protein